MHIADTEFARLVASRRPRGNRPQLPVPRLQRGLGIHEPGRAARGKPEPPPRLVERVESRTDRAVDARCRRPDRQRREAGKGNRRLARLMELSLPQRALAIRRATSRLCIRLGWAPLHEVALPNGRRADILALRSDGCLACIEVKSGPRDFLTDLKWRDYREFADELF